MKSYITSILFTLPFWVACSLAEEEEDNSVYIHKDWPTQIAVPAKLEKLHAKNSDKNEKTKKNFEYKSLFYTYTSEAKLSENTHQEISAILDCTYLAAVKLSKVLPIKRKLKARPSSKKLKARFNLDPLVIRGKTYKGGVYDSGTDTINMTFRVARISPDGQSRAIYSGIIQHEATHQYLAYNKVPTWVDEGLAEYVGFMPFDGEYLDFTESIDYIVDRSVSAAPLVYPFKLTELFEMDQDEFYERQAKGQNTYFISCLTVTYFLHLSGEKGLMKFKDFLRALSKGTSPAKAARKLYKNNSQLQEDLIKAWKKQGLDIRFTESQDE